MQERDNVKCVLLHSVLRTVTSCGWFLHHACHWSLQDRPYSVATHGWKKTWNMQQIIFPPPQLNPHALHPTSFTFTKSSSRCTSKRMSQVKNKVSSWCCRVFPKVRSIHLLLTLQRLYSDQQIVTQTCQHLFLPYIIPFLRSFVSLFVFWLQVLNQPLLLFKKRCISYNLECTIIYKWDTTSCF